MSLAPSVAWRIERHETLPSTNDRAIAAAEAGEAPGLVVLAAEQTAGRGRAGRAWASSPGNLFCSVLLPPLPALRGGAGALLAGLAAHQALSPAVPPPHALRLKWPNDLMVGSAKLGGILVEAGTTARGEPWLVAGIGANLAAAPVAVGRPVTSVAALGGRAEPGPVAGAIAGALAEALEAFAGGGMAWLVRAWSERALAEGTAISVQAVSGRLSGRYAGLDGDGALLLATGEGVRRVVAGEVFAEA